ncbi:hypothetical protein J2S68_004108 [Glycomyces algeriensis]|nr:hypothetical protein [Glycomyces algeriensis]
MTDNLIGLHGNEIPGPRWAEFRERNNLTERAA